MGIVFNETQFFKPVITPKTVTAITSANAKFLRSLGFKVNAKHVKN